MWQPLPEEYKDIRSATPGEYKEMLNDALKEHPEYKEGMKFLSVPDNSHYLHDSYLAGYNWKGPFDRINVFTQVGVHFTDIRWY